MHADSVTKTARRLGLLYFLLAVSTVLDEFFLGTGFVVANDAAATAHNILADPLRFRLSFLFGVIGQSLSVVLIVGLYRLFRNVDARQALLMLIFWMMGSVLVLATMSTKLLTLAILNGGDYLPGFTGQQLESLAFVFYKMRTGGMSLVIGFWGLWLFPFGVLVIRSRMFPRILGYCLFVAGLGYVISSLTAIAFPDANKALSSYLMPLYFGEIPIILWLLIKGAKAPDPLVA